MNRMTLAELARAVEGTAHGDPDLQVGPAVVIDARLATPGCLFVAIRGERVDGHDFAVQAREAGAVVMLGTRLVEDAGLAQVVVDDAVAALSRLAHVVVDEARRNDTVVVAVTGSSGKTSTKDLLAQVLEAAGPTVSPVGSFNNEIGVPLTACEVDETTKYLVSEMGARGIGHLSWLTSLVQPDVSVVLNVGTAHLGEFGSAENIAIAKGELVEALDAGGWAVLNADDARVRAMATRTPAHRAFFTTGDDALAGEDAELVVRARDIVADDLQRHGFTLVVERDGAVEQHPVQLQVLGVHQVANALAAAAAAIAAGVRPALVAQALTAAAHRSQWRMQLDQRADGAAILNDSYNANPDSMTAALHALAELVRSRRGVDASARGIAVLGEMLELGAGSAAEHERMGRLAGELGIDAVVTVDEPAGDNHAVQLAHGAEATGTVVRIARRDDVAALLTGELHLSASDVVLVKASRGVALNKVADQLLAGTPAASPADDPAVRAAGPDVPADPAAPQGGNPR